MFRIVRRNLNAFKIEEVESMLNNDFESLNGVIQHGENVFFVGEAKDSSPAPDFGEETDSEIE